MTVPTARGDLLLGIDAGTTNLKVVATTPGGRVVKVARRAVRIERPGPVGHSGFDLDRLERDLDEALAEVAAAIEPKRVAGIGVVSVGESFVGIDSDGRRTTDCPTWFDRRTRNSRAELGLTIEDWYDVTGMVDDDIYTVHRLGWRRAQNHATDRVARWLCIADLVVFRLTGRAVAAPSLAARTGLADRTSGRWSHTICGGAGIDPDRLPELLPAATVAAGLLPAVASRIGLDAGIPVVNAGHDHPAAGLGSGLCAPGDAVDSTGTAEALKSVVLAPLAAAAAGGAAYDCYPHAVPGAWLLSGHIPSSGGLLDWLARLTGGATPPAALWDEAAASPPGARGVRLAPFLEGTGAPWNRRERRGGLDGLSGEVTRGDLLRAGAEAIAAWLAINVDAFERLTGRPLERLIVVGGGARNPLLNEIKAAVLGRPLILPAISEAAALGAALVAGLAVGRFADAAAAAALDDVTWNELRPDLDLRQAYARIEPELAALFPGR
jgi:sugar (pentulose or hexulose) kinase